METDQYQIHMFHFRCPLCGSEPKTVPLREYVRQWSKSSPERLHQALVIIGGALVDLSESGPRWVTKNFSKSASKIIDYIGKLPFDPPVSNCSHLRKIDHDHLEFSAACPICNTGAGIRTASNYFTEWRDACKVQTGNLLYESGLTLWAVLLGMPDWSNGPFLAGLNEIRLAMREAGKAMSLLECPKCGRLTSCLYGSPDPENCGSCRWCHDMGGGLGLGLAVSFDSSGMPVVKMAKVDYGAPARNAWDILPPETVLRLS